MLAVKLEESSSSRPSDMVHSLGAFVWEENPAVWSPLRVVSYSPVARPQTLIVTVLETTAAGLPGQIALKMTRDLLAEELFKRSASDSPAEDEQSPEDFAESVCQIIDVRLNEYARNMHLGIDFGVQGLIAICENDLCTLAKVGNFSVILYRNQKAFLLEDQAQNGFGNERVLGRGGATVSICSFRLKRGDAITTTNFAKSDAMIDLVACCLRSGGDLELASRVFIEEAIETGMHQNQESLLRPRPRVACMFGLSAPAIELKEVVADR